MTLYSIMPYLLKEALIQSTLARVSSGEFPPFRQAATATGVSAQMKKSLC